MASEGCAGGNQIGGDHEVLTDYLEMLDSADVILDGVATKV